MRTKNSIVNISVGLMNQIIITLLSFFSRKVFIDSLGIEYLGINGLFTNILAMLSLAESGIGSSIIYSLYKPVAENNEEKINVLMKLYRNSYWVIATIILLLGLSLMPFLDYFIKNSNVKDINLIYILFLINTIIPYLFLHKNSFLNVSQKAYIITGLYSVSSIISISLKIGILHYTKNYILYLVTDIIITTTTSIILLIIVNKMYPFLKNKVSTKLDSETKNNIIKNIKAIVIQNIGGYLVFGTDNIIISSFVSVAAVGLYSNYNMLIEISRTFLNQVFMNIYHSVGNLVAKESKEKVYSVYKIIRLLNFWLYALITIFLFVTIEPLITIWLGSEFLMSKGILTILLIIFYERGMRNSITTVKTTAGIFHDDRYAPLCQAVVNLFVSIILVQYIGIAGVFLGTLISALVIPFWTTPYLVYKKIFNRPVINYFLKYTHYTFLGIGNFLITNFICNLISPNSLLIVVLRGFVCLIVVNLVFVAIFNKTKEFKYLWGIIKKIIEGLLKNSIFYVKTQKGNLYE